MSDRVRVGLVGIGNNACAMVQGVWRYSDPAYAERMVEGCDGIRFPRLCGYEIRDVEFSSAFDVDARKIGIDLGRAIFSPPNCYPRVVAEPIDVDVPVTAAPVLDGVPDFLAEMVHVAVESRGYMAEDHIQRCARVVRESRTHVLVNFLPSGCDLATTFFARVAAEGGAAFINCTPTPVAHSVPLRTMFEEAGLPLLGDDLESQFGSSLLHRTLLSALEDRGLEVSHSYQVNLGGNTDFKNLAHRPDAKRRSKMKAISTARARDQVDIIPSGGYVRGLGDHKVGYIVITGRGWLGTPVTIDLKLEVQDSSNAAGVTIDLVRLAKGAMDQGMSGNVPLSYYFKNPLTDKLETAKALEAIHEFDRLATDRAGAI